MIEIDGASNRGIDEIRDLREKIGYASAQSSSKIYIIDEVHMLTTQAFNALLKTLEEPPGHVYLIFATTEPHKIPATILSRCQRFNFKRLELAELSGQLSRICETEKIEFDPEALTLICRRADGSMRDAESLLDQCISAAEGKIDLETVRKVLGLVDSRIVSGLLDAVSRRDREGALAVVDSVSSSGMDLEEFFIAFIEGIRNLLVISVSAGRTEWLDLTSDEIKELSAIAGKFNVEDLLFLFRSMSRAHRELKGTSNPRYHIEVAVTEAASWESAVEIGELIGRLESGTGGASSTTKGPAPASKKARTDRDSTAGAANTAAGTSGLPESPVMENPLLAALGGKEEWERFLAQVREAKLTVGIWLMSADVAGVENGKLILSFSPQNRFAMAMIGDMKNRRLIEKHLEKFYGRKFTVETCEMVDIRGGRPDRQAEMEIGARTKPGGSAGAQEQSTEDPAPDASASDGVEQAKKIGQAAEKSSRPDAVANPALERIMDRLDAELLD